MRITILAAGSRGDIQPYVALGKGLKAAGFDVNIATHEYFERFVRSRGLDYSLLNGDPRAILAGSRGQDWLQSSYRPLAFMKRMRQTLEPFIGQLLQDSLVAARGSQALLFGVISAFAGFTIAEKLGIQAVPALKQHVHPTRAYPCGMVRADVSLGGWYNRLTYPVGYQVYWQFLRPVVNRWRKDLGMPPGSPLGPIGQAIRLRTPCLYGFSPHVIPTPAEWGAEVHTCGYWELKEEETWTPPEDLLRFLEDGPPPVYIGFGSMVNRNAEAVTRITLEALRRTGQRGVLLSGWGGIGRLDLPENVYHLQFAPHDWLLPRMAAVVHHGGSGTTAAGLKAGKPSVLVPFFADQPYWGWHVRRLGVGPRPVAFTRLSAERLAGAIDAALHDRAMAARAAALGEKLHQEDGVSRGVEAMRRILGQI